MIRTINHGHPVSYHFYRLFGTRTGIINGIWDILPDPGSGHGMVNPPETARMGPLLGTEGEYSPSLKAAGKGVTLREKYLTCIGETAERYCSTWPATETEIASYAKIQTLEDVSVPDFPYLDIYDRHKHDGYFIPLTKETPILWERGTDLLTGRSVAVPSELVRINTGERRERVQFGGSSNGTATGQSLLSAAVASFLEIIERDAFMRTWCCQRSPSFIDLDSYTIAQQFVAETVDENVHSIALLRLSSPMDIPTVAAIKYSNDGTFPAFSITAASAFDPVDAIQEAVLESTQSELFLWQAQLDQKVEDIQIENVLNNLEDNMLYYAQPEHFDEVSFLFGSENEKMELPHTPDLSNPREKLAYLCREFDRIGATPILFDITTRDIQDVGLRVTSAVVPELVDLSPPAALPVSHPVFSGETITTKPHPFP